MESSMLFDSPRIARAMSRALNRDLTRVVQQCPSNQSGQPPQKYARNQIVDFLRKSEYDLGPNSLPSHEARVKAAIDKFKSVSEHVIATNLELEMLNLDSFRGKRLDDWTESDFFARDLSRMKCFIQQVLGKLDVDTYFRGCKSSSGVTLGLKFSATDLEDKWRYPLTGTAEAVSLFELYLEWDPTFRDALVWFNRNSKHPRYKVVSDSRTSGVSKTSSIARLIAVEPTLNMFFQQGLMAAMSDCLKPWVDIETAQELHHYYAMFGSLTGLVSTYDMTSASDTVARMLVFKCTPSSWFAELDRVACKSTYHRHENGVIERFTLPMFSTMGNATTFPIETLFFYAMLITMNSSYTSSYACFPEENWETKRISVYGDDCIVPHHLNQHFEWLAGKCGFIVNMEKSHYDSEDSFRESCGVDYLSGHNIRSFFLSEPHNQTLSSHEAWLYVVVNNVFKKLIYNFGRLNYIYMCPCFLRVVRLVFRKYKIEVKYVPSYFPEDSGIRWFNDPRITPALAGCDMSPVYVDEHGTARFFSLRFEYTKDRNPFKFLRYSVHIKGLDDHHWWSSEVYPKYGRYTPGNLRAMALALAKASAESSPRLSVTKRKKLVIKTGTMRTSTSVTQDTFAQRTTKKVGAYQKVSSIGWMTSV